MTVVVVAAYLASLVAGLPEHELARGSLVPRAARGTPTADAALLSGPLYLLSQDLLELSRHVGSSLRKPAGIAVRLAEVVS
jgi:hypothetical protein